MKNNAMALNLQMVSVADLQKANSTDMVSGTSRPSHLIAPYKKKKKEFILPMVKSIAEDFNRNYPYLFYNDRFRYDNIVNKIQGIVSGNFLAFTDQNISHGTNLTSVNADKRVLNLLSKYFRLLEGKLDDVKFDITIKPNNSLARAHNDEYRSLLETLMQVNKIIKENNLENLQAIMGQYGFDVPDNTEELEIQLQTSKPNMLAMYIKRAIREINYLDKADQKFSEADYPLVAFGAVGIKTTINQNGVPVREVIDPRNLLVGYTNTEDFRDIGEVGAYRMVTINDIREEDNGKEFTHDDLKEIESHCMGKYGNSYNIGGNQGDYLFGKYRCLVADIYFYSYDEDVFVAENDKNGNMRVHDKKYGYYRGKESEHKSKYPDKRLYRTCTQNVYKATWIAGTDLIYNYGLVDKVSRPGTDIYKCELPISVIAPLIKNGRTVSLIEEMLTVVDRADMFWKKMEQSLASARPPGFQMDIDSLMAVVTGLAGQGYKFEDVVKMTLENNIVFTSSKGMGGTGHSNQPFEERFGGLGSDFGKYYEGLQGCIQLLQEISGFGNVAAGSPVKYTGKKVAELAVQSADYAIKHLFRAKRALYENVMQTSVRLLLDSITYGESMALRKYIGDNAFDFIKQNAAAYECVLMVEFRSTDQEWQDVRDAANMALKVPLAEGGISYPDFLRVMQQETIEEAEMIMRLLYNKNKRDAAKAKERDIKANGEQQRMSNDQAAQAKQQELAMQQQHEASLIDKQTAAAIDLRRVEYLFTVEEEKLKGLIKSDHLEIQGEIDKGIEEIAAKYNMDKLKGKEVGKKKAT